MIYGYVDSSKKDAKAKTTWRTENLQVLGVLPENLRVSRKIGKFREEKPAGLMRSMLPGDTLAVTAVSQLAQDADQLCFLVGLAYERKLRLLLGAVELDFSGELRPELDGVLDMAHLILQIGRETGKSGKSGKSGKEKKTVKTVKSSKKDQGGKKEGTKGKAPDTGAPADWETPCRPRTAPQPVAEASSDKE